MIPLKWHLEAWNTGTCLYMFWAGLVNLNQFINAVVWNGNAINWAPVWCDISVRIFLAGVVAIPACTLCINRRLYQIASVRSVTVTKAEKRRAVMVDLAIGVGIPLLFITLQYIAEGHRFDIYEDIGCFPSTYNTPVAIVLVSVPPVLIGSISAVYSILSIRAFAKSRRQFKELLSGSNNLNSNRYLRLMLLAGIETCLTVPLGLFAIYESCVLGEVYPWKGWADTHSHFSRVIQVPAILWRSDAGAVRDLELNRFTVVLCAFLFFGFFGFAEEARKHYRSGVQSVAKRMGVSTSGTLFSSTGSKSKGSLTSTSGKASLPVFVEREVVRKRDSFDSLTDMSMSYNSSFNEKDEKDHSIVPSKSCEDMKIADIGGVLADYKEDTISPTPSSGSSASSFSEPSSPHATRPDSDVIEVSSLRTHDVASASDLALPEAAHYSSRNRHLSDSSPV
ncbi:hypothetical protein H0H87_002092 [Tephrocybe sp. NHM501043]|nr:hypothetical protein H0H87_002092 [Tephrocybe sp. NHM501043]